MTRMVQSKRGSILSKRLDMSKIRNVFADGRTWTTIGLVTAPDSGSHFTVEDGDVIIEVVTQPDLLPLSCRLLACSGVWLIPAAGEEVGVIIPSGDIGFMPLAMPMLSTGSVPEDVSDTAIVIARTKVYIHNGTGATEPVAKISELNALADVYNGHTHQAYAPSAITSPPMTEVPGVNPPINPSYPVVDPINQYLPGTPDSDVASFSGTAVLEAK